MNYGTLAVFEKKEIFLAALKSLDDQKITYDCYSSFELDEMTEHRDSAFRKNNIVKKAALGGFASGIFTAFFMQWYAIVKDTPWNIAGKPLNSWPSMIPIGFVLTVLFTGISLYTALFYRLGFPQPYHPVFNAKTYNLSLGNFSILIRHSTPETQALLQSLNANTLEEVPW
jgi:hypothetical protein